jgi:hypothetical protein
MTLAPTTAIPALKRGREATCISFLNKNVTWTREIYPQVRNGGSPFGRNDFTNFTCINDKKFTGISRQNSCTNIGGLISIQNGKQLTSNVSEQLFRNWQAPSTYLSVARKGGAAASRLPPGCRNRPGSLRAEV